MYQGTTLQNLAVELERQAKAKIDFLADTRYLRFEPTADGEIQLTGELLPDNLRLNSIAHGQMSEVTQVPKKYYDRCLAEAPDLLARNLNHWLETQPKRRLIRTLDGRVRAVLSDRYRPLDNYDFANAVLPVLHRLGGEVTSCAITEDRLFLKVIKPDLTAEIMPPGAEKGKGHDSYDVVQAGLVLSNSEVGRGMLALQPAVHTVKCTNLAVFKDNAMQKTHLGRALGGDGADTVRWLTDETRRREDEAYWLKVRDLTTAAMDGRIFDDHVATLKAKRGVPLEDAQGSVERLGTRFGLGEDEQQSVLDHLIGGGDLSQYGLHAAITRASQDADNYSRATDLERLGGEVIELPAKDWTQLTSG